MTVDAVTADNTVTDTLDTYSFGIVQQKAGGSWKRISPSDPAQVKPGGTLKLRVFLRGPDGDVAVPIPAFSIPKKAKGRAKLSLRGGNSGYSYFYGRSVAALQKRIAAAVRHDQVLVTLQAGGGRSNASTGSEADYRGPSQPVPPTGPSSAFSLEKLLGPVDYVVDGKKSIPVKIKK